MKRSTLRRFGHIERMGNEESVKEVYLSSVEGTNRRGRPLLRWEDRVKEYVSERGVRGNGPDAGAHRFESCPVPLEMERLGSFHHPSQPVVGLVLEGLGISTTVWVVALNAQPSSLGMYPQRNKNVHDT